MSDLLNTPLHSIHLDLGAKMGPFAGYDMPIQYEGILAEHQHTRSVASIFDTCHMGELELQGPTAEADLERLLSMNVAAIPVGRCRYGFLLNEQGGVIDDLTCYRRGPRHFFLVVNAGTLAADCDWISRQLSPDTVFTNCSPNRAKIDVQGPRVREIMENILNANIPDLPYFGFCDVEMARVPMTISRTGYTGEFGYELYMDDAQAVGIWTLLTLSGEIKPAGLGARDTLRLEMGYALYGHELDATHSPVAASRGAFISLKKEFIGKASVEAELNNPSRYLVGLQLETKRAARAGDILYKGDIQVGTVTSGSLSPSLGHAVALAEVDVAQSDIGTRLEVELRGKRLAATVCKFPFYTEGSARKG